MNIWLQIQRCLQLESCSCSSQLSSLGMLLLANSTAHQNNEFAIFQSNYLVAMGVDAKNRAFTFILLANKAMYT